MKRKTTTEFIAEATRIHSGKYDYSNVSYINSFHKIKIICPIHGVFYQTPHEHLRAECLKCGKEKCIKSRTLNTEKFIKKATQIHGNIYDYGNVCYTHNEIKIPIKCPRHGVFYQTPNSHLQNQGCPRCRTSKGEKKIMSYMDARKIPYEYNKSFPNCTNPKTNRRLIFDFYIQSQNLIIEFDGEQHFHPVHTKLYSISSERVAETQYRDQLKSSYAKTNGISILRIPYTEIYNIDSILTKEMSIC